MNIRTGAQKDSKSFKLSIPTKYTIAVRNQHHNFAIDAVIKEIWNIIKSCSKSFEYISIFLNNVDDEGHPSLKISCFRNLLNI